MNGAGREDKTAEFFGIGVSPGIVIGRALLARCGGAVQKREIGGAEVPQEQQRFREAVARAEEKLLRLRDHISAVLADYGAIIDSHLLMLRDRFLYERTLEIIDKERANAEWALEKALAHVEKLFARMDDAYIRARFDDVRHAVEGIFAELSGTEKLPALNGGKVVLVARDFSPEDILHMRGNSVGFLAAMGGETSHAAIVARTLGIPAVVGVKDIAAGVHDGDLLILDGSTGRVFINPSVDLISRYQERQSHLRRYSLEAAGHAHLRSETVDGMRVNVEANLESGDEISQAFQCGAAGVGLFRSEYLYLAADHLPDEETLLDAYRDLLSLAAPFPVTIRTLDVGGDKLFVGQGKGAAVKRCKAGERCREANPALGLRAIRYSLREPAIFTTQLRALLRASTAGNLRILFPMISSYCELIQVKEIIARLREDLRGQGIPFDENVKFGIMVEVPSAVAVADTLAREVDFFSIGTNDLIQYALAIDRGNEQVAHMYEPLHPAVLRMISHVVQSGHRGGIEVGICGEMAGQEKYLPVLLGLGLDSFSMHPPAIPFIKKMIRKSRSDEVEELAAQLLASSSSIEARKCLQRYLADHHPELVKDNAGGE
ncbi:MAG: phosphoenolpyruvate--protein phosphotransferase [Desulfobulbaceae bacterium DB1]|nr:MAG: phosphoenolpyruvate--protein phosphotransferase [Desulfobulbaceae bacterium DB1]